MLLRRGKVSLGATINMQRKDLTACDRLLQCVRDAMPGDGEVTRVQRVMEELREKRDAETADRKAERLKIAYQEEYELIQRKFLRHIVKITEKLDAFALPALMVFDFSKSGKFKA